MVDTANKIFQLNWCWIRIYVDQCIISIFFLQCLKWIHDNNYLYFLISFLIHILDVFDRLSSNSTCLGVIPRLLYVIFSIRAIRFSSNVKISYLSLLFPKLIGFLDIPNFLNNVTACYFTKKPVELLDSHCYITIYHQNWFFLSR